jgi:3-oxoacyl-[acyl-carrier protein] reductase
VRAVDAAIPHFTAAGGGAVVAVSSISGIDTGTPSAPNSYAAMKAAVIQHSSARAHALAAQGIRVNTVSPGPIEFPGGDWDRVREGRPALYDMIKEKIALGRYGRPEEVAKAIVYLASPAASFCTGVNLVVDGGMLTRVQF